MTGRYQLIEQKILSLGSAGFQNLCDLYLAARESEVISFNRTGSHFGEQKTIKGTPDMFFRSANGQMTFVEHTTQKKGIVKKVKEDIDSCLNEAKTKVPAKSIHRIIACCNLKMSPSDEKELFDYSKDKVRYFELISLDILAIDIFLKYPEISRDFLSIPFDTGQILKIESFVESYDSRGKNLSTQLSNPFLHRTKEIDDCLKAIMESDLLIISGFAGVGKTKLGLEVIKKYSSLNKGCRCFVIDKKDRDIYDDLMINIKAQNEYLLLIDDANRQLPNLRQVLHLLGEPNGPKIKIILTVRNYALNEIIQESTSFSYQKIILEKFSDDEIKELISSEPFGIKNGTFHKKILNISDGNARLAIMASMLANRIQSDFLDGGVYELFDDYFKTFIKDKSVFNDSRTLKALGLISFFFTLDFSENAFFNQLIFDFQLDKKAFIESVDELHRYELVEVKSNYVRVSEQVMATYFFYTVFIKEELLSFQVLLNKYFKSFDNRFKETVIDSNNSFGYAKVLSKIELSLTDYLYRCEETHDKYQFLDVFWLYLQNETLEILSSRINSLQEETDKTFSAHYEMNDYVYDQDEILKRLKRFYLHHTHAFLPALELSFLYATKRPSVLPELVRRLREHFVFEYEEERYGFVRQRKLIDLISERAIVDNPLFVAIFFALTKNWLRFRNEVHSSARNNAISIYRYPFPPVDYYLELRGIVWDTVFELFSTHEQNVLNAIDEYRRDIDGTVEEILEYDLNRLIPFIKSRFDPSKFEHIRTARELHNWLRKEDSVEKVHLDYLKSFDSPEYSKYRILDWNYHRGKEDYEFDDHREFERLKKQDLAKTFLFNSPNEFQPFMTLLQHCLDHSPNPWWLGQSVSEVILVNLDEEFDLGYDLFKRIILDFGQQFNSLNLCIRKVVEKSTEAATSFLEFIRDSDLVYKSNWAFPAFYHLPVAFINETYTTQLLELVRTSYGENRVWFYFDFLENFLPFNEGIFSEILRVIVDRNNKGHRLTYHDDLFEKHLDDIDSLELLEQAYFQQVRLQEHFDFDKKGLELLCNRDSSILIRFVKEFATTNNLRFDEHLRLNFVWSLKEYDHILSESMKIITEQYLYLGISKHPMSAFFAKIPSENVPLAEGFILKSVENHHGDAKYMDALLDITKRYFSGLKETIVMKYLSLNYSLEDFKKIRWFGSGGVYSGHVNFGEMHSRQWQSMLEIVEKCEKQIDLLPIKTYLRREILREKKNAENERLRDFINPRD